MAEPLELVEDDDEVLRYRPECDQLSVERLGILRRGGCRALDRALDHLDVESDLLLERTKLALRGPPHALVWMPDHRIVDTADEAGDAHNALEVDLDDVERRRVVAVGLAQLERQLIRECRLAGVPRAEQARHWSVP